MQTSEQDWVTGTALDAWQRLLRANCVLMRTLDHELQAGHGMTISDYDVLVSLHHAEDHSLRMSDLSRRTLLTRSGMTRLVQGLERDGLVERRPCETDARVSFAVLTPDGVERLAAARRTHHAGIRRMFADHFSDEDAATLSELLGRIPGVADGSETSCCGGGDDDA
jgi:DNA-binding MarR family transcriptional regulator